mgnify:FL=1
MRLLALLLIYGSTGIALAAEHARPNVVLILADDQGWQDYGFMGSQIVHTPHLDQLAQRSLVFERGYVVAPLCRPSLASIVTGLYPHQHGVCANDVSPARGLERAKENQPVYESFHQLPSWIRVLVNDGYLAFQSGKWWEGSWRDGGFTHGMTHGDALRGGRHGDEGLKIGRQGMTPITQFIDQAVAAEKPFVVWYAPFLPHTPHNPPADLLKKYQVAGRAENLAKYYAMCEWFDATCGELLDHLEEQDLTENTLVLFLADNGWVARDDSAELPQGWWNDYAPRSKGSPFEAGIRTPIMISWPTVITPERSSELASSLDLMPTILSACGLDAPENLPGIDLLDDQAKQDRNAIFGAAYSIHNMNPGDPASTLQYRWCIQGDRKLMLRSHGSDTTPLKTVHEWDDVPVRLYNLKLNPGENENLASREKETVMELSRRLARQIPASTEEPATH